jgi:hypothetical protein
LFLILDKLILRQDFFSAQRRTTSALGQKQTFRSAIAMSALPPTADIREHVRHVRFGSLADILQRMLEKISKEEKYACNIPKTCDRDDDCCRNRWNDSGVGGS